MFDELRWQGIAGAEMTQRRAGIAIGVAVMLLLVACAGAPRSTETEPGTGVQGAINGLDFRLMRDYRIEGRRVGIVVSDWLYCYPPTGELILVPRGYMTDFASIPSVVRPFIDVFGNNAEAAVAHDWLYAIGEEGQRQKADELFRFALKEQGVNFVTRNAMHAGVRTGGGGAYGRPGEWDKRFGDPLLGQPLKASPFQRRKTAVVAKLDSCAALDSAVKVSKLLSQYSSSRWPGV